MRTQGPFLNRLHDHYLMKLRASSIRDEWPQRIRVLSSSRCRVICWRHRDRPRNDVREVHSDCSQQSVFSERLCRPRCTRRRHSVLGARRLSSWGPEDTTDVLCAVHRTSYVNYSMGTSPPRGNFIPIVLSLHLDLSPWGYLR